MDVTMLNKILYGLSFHTVFCHICNNSLSMCGVLVDLGKFILTVLETSMSIYGDMQDDCTQTPTDLGSIEHCPTS